MVLLNRFFFGNNTGLKNFDLETNAIKLFPNTNLTMIRKESEGVSYAFYSYAREKGSNRGGTFIGSALYYQGKKADENATIKILSSFLKKLKEDNLTDENVLKVEHSSHFTVSEPEDFQKLSNSSNEILSFSSSFSNKKLVVFDVNGSTKLEKYLKKALQLLDTYDAVYFTADEEVAKFVKKQGLFQFVDKNGFYALIEQLKREREQKCIRLKQKLEKEKQDIEDKKHKTNKILQAEMEKCEKIHEENAKKLEEFKEEVSKVETIYSSFKDGIDELSQGLNNSNTREIEQKLSSLQEDLQNEISRSQQVVRASSMDMISNNRNISGRANNHYTNYPTPSTSSYENKELNPRLEKSNNVRNRKKIVILAGICVIIFLVFILYLFLYLCRENNELEKENLKTQTPTTSSVQNPRDTLSPKPNYMDEKSRLFKELNQDFKHKKDKIGNVVDKIFEKNPNDIKKPYENQRKLYTEELYNNNHNSFEIKMSDTIIIDSLKFIPTTKK